MMPTDPRAETFKTKDADSYDDLTAEFDQFTERFTKPLAKHLVALAHLGPSERVLDIGTGTGVVALLSAQQVGAGGEIVGIDLSQGMLRAAAEKASRAGLAGRVEFRPMDAEHLQFEEGSFDAAISMFALLHFPDPLASLKEIHRVVRPGGRIALAVGSAPPLVSRQGWKQALRHACRLWLRHTGKLLVAPGFLDSLVESRIPGSGEAEESLLASRSGSRAGIVAKLVEAAGFRDLQTDWLGHEPVVDSPQDFWEVQRTFSSIARKRLNRASPQALEAVRKEFLDSCGRVQGRGGKLMYPFAAFYVTATRPALV